MTVGQLQKLLDVWAHRLGLEKWDLHLRAGAEDLEDYMAVFRPASYERAVIEYAPWLLTGVRPSNPDIMPVEVDDLMIEEYLVHELLHLYLTGMASVLIDDLDGMLHRDVYTVVTAAFKREEERTVDKLARVLVKAFSTIKS